MVNADGSDFSQFQRSRQDPLLSLDAFYDHALQEKTLTEIAPEIENIKL
jgi:hypothetical protein